MKIENHILDILQLYEYGMAIGQSLNYKESCDQFLKLLLRRKNLNASWILEKSEDNKFVSTYSIPKGAPLKISYSEKIASFLDFSGQALLTSDLEKIKVLSPIKLETGSIAIINLKEQGFLFLYSKKNNIDSKEINQLEPVIKKFIINLKSCKAFEKQTALLRELEQQNRELSDYAHMVSHDLKAPLRSVDTLAAWLIEDNLDKLDDHWTNQLNLIRTNVEKMDALINGILNYSTLSNESIELYEVDTEHLVNEIISTIHLPEGFKTIIHPLPKIKGDKSRLLQLFQNLIENAIKYNDKKNGILEIGFEDIGSHWKFYIKDNGQGIEEKYFDKIFETFQKLENSIESTGIGLSIAKKIVEIYGGEIWLDSKINEGTTFYFTLQK